MSDATSPPRPRSSSAAPVVVEGSQKADSSSGEGEFDTALDQFTGSATKECRTGDSGVRTDNKHKRKRTSPADQAVLEAEYKQNPKPNKAARAEIVNKVSLNEKEVQIWFQNRRQINRRKSRPLLPHEIAAFGLRGMAVLSDPASFIAFGSSQSGGELEASSEKETISSHEEPGISQDGEDDLLPKLAKERVEITKAEGLEAVADDKPAFLPPTLMRQASSGISLTECSSMPTTENVIKSFSSTPGYLANRWNSVNSSLSSPTSSQLTFCTPPISSANQPVSCPERLDSSSSTPSSLIRLSLSLDGKAELITGPSPPHPISARPTSSSGPLPQKRMPGLQRSHSALPLAQPSSITDMNPPFMPRIPIGRSRDARTWEFCCDPEAQDELTTQAENESHGSALAAISLIRSASSSALKPNINKRNAPATKHDSNKHGKRPKFARVTPSVARLQNLGKTSSRLSQQPPQQPSSYAKDGLMHSPSGDSDKENWIPNEHGSNPRRRPLPSSRSDKQQNPRAVLGDNFNVPTHAVNFGGGRHQNRKPANVAPEVFEDQENSGDVPAEVEKFMRGEISPSKKGDLDCIQGLLSLSQGNWR